MMPRRFALALFMFLWGAFALVSQSILLRETMVLFFGGELSWGVVLSAWLLGITVGAAVGAGITQRLSRPPVALALSSLAMVLLVSIAMLVLRECRGHLSVGVGEHLSITAAAAIAVATVGPCGAMIGLAFPLVVAAAGAGSAAAARQIGWVYLVESAGSLVGGAAFTFWLVERFDPFTVLFVVGAAVLGPLVWLQSRTSGRVWMRPLLGAVSFVLLVCAGAGVSASLDRWSVERRWQGFAPHNMDLVASHDTRYQNLALGRLADQYSLYANGLRLTDFPQYWGDYRLATHIAVSQHPQPQRVLLLGGGADGPLAEILLHRSVRLVDYVELDPAVLQMIRPYLPDRDISALDDPRVRVHHADARQFVKQADTAYDLILAMLPSPSSVQIARFHTQQFFHEVRNLLTPDGIYVFTADAPPGELHAESRRYLASLVATLRTAFEDVVVEWGVTPRIFACRTPGWLTTDPRVLASRLLRHGCVILDLEPGQSSDLDRTALYSAFFAGTDWLAPDKVAQRRTEIETYAGAAVYTDARPAAYIDWFIWWDKQQRGPSARLFEWMQRISSWQVLLAAVAAMALWQVLRRSLSPRPRPLSDAVLLCVVTTGLSAMALEIVLLFAFQSLYGYVYQRIGLIIAVFMFGLVIGSGGMNRILRRRLAGSLSLLVVIAVLLGLSAATIPLILTGLGRLGNASLAEPVIFSLVFAIGLFGGLVFPLAAALLLRSRPAPTRTAGWLEAADHGGACLGALVTGLLLVPVLGMAATCYILAVLNIAVAGWLAVVPRIWPQT
ncbi:MAG TPA: fused MFS/spermidine synthase [Phycisphaerae bacterium]|nr:fused MFS/spermidine synthase [Phycisphaerae bacterium]